MIGFVNCLKIPGSSSAREVAIAKRRFGVSKAGHMGTLDPLAAGVLPLALGNASRLFDLVSAQPKRYTASIKFGLQTDTLDYGGQVVASDNKVITADMLETVLDKFRGEIQQTPPIFSAIKISGKRAYDIARNGGQADMPIRTVNISELNFITYDNDEFVLDVKCSSGTYIRSLIRDIAVALDTVGTMSALVRTEACGMRISQSKVITELSEGDVIPIWEVVPFPIVTLEGDELFRAKNGAVFSVAEHCANPDYFYIRDGAKLLALAKANKDCTAKPVITF